MIYGKKWDVFIISKRDQKGHVIEISMIYGKKWDDGAHIFDLRTTELGIIEPK